VVCALLAAFLVMGRFALPWQRVEPSRAPLPEPPPRPMPLARALVVAAALTVPLSLAFALRTSLGIAPILAFVLWRSVSPRALTVAGAVLLGVVVPVLYAGIGPTNQGGYSSGYANSLISAHWAGLAAVLLLALACWRTLAATHGRRPEPARPPPPDAERGRSRRDLELAGQPARAD
jgi:hypothetical protein